MGREQPLGEQCLANQFPRLLQAHRGATSALQALPEARVSKVLELKSSIDAVRMAQDLKVDPVMNKLIKINEEKDNKIKQKCSPKLNEF